MIERGVEEGAELLVDGRGPAGGRGRLLPRSDDPRRGHRDGRRPRGRSSGRCSRWCRGRHRPRPSTPSLTAGSATGCRSSPSRERRCAASSTTSTRAWWRERRRRRRWPSSRSAAGRTASCRRPARPAQTPSSSTPRRRPSRAASTRAASRWLLRRSHDGDGRCHPAGRRCRSSGGGSEPVDATTAQRCPSRAPKGIRMPRWRRPKRATLLVGLGPAGARCRRFGPGVRAGGSEWSRPALMIDDATNCGLRGGGERARGGVAGYNSLWERDRRRYSMWAARFDREASVLVRTLRGLGARQIVWVTLRELRPGLVTPGGARPVRALRVVLPVREQPLAPAGPASAADVVLAKWHTAATTPARNHVRRDPHEHDRLAHHGANDLAAREQRPAARAAQEVSGTSPARRAGAAPPRRDRPRRSRSAPGRAPARPADGSPWREPDRPRPRPQRRRPRCS